MGRAYIVGCYLAIAIYTGRHPTQFWQNGGHPQGERDGARRGKHVGASNKY